VQHDEAAALLEGLSCRTHDFLPARLDRLPRFLRERAPGARVAVRPTPGAEQWIRAEAGEGPELVPAERGACVDAVVELCAPT